MNLSVVCQDVLRQAVFVGQVVEATGPYPGSRAAKVKVEEAFFNSAAVDDLVVVDSGYETICHYDLKAGERYIFHAALVPKTETLRPAQYRLSTLSHTRPLKGGEHVLAALRSLRGKQPTALYGRVTEYANEDRPMAGVSIEIEGPSTQRKAVSDANGEFRILDIPAGEYRVRLSKAGFVRTESGLAEKAALTAGAFIHRPGILEVSGTTCNAYYFMMTPASRIHGVVRDSQGRPLENIRVKVFPYRRPKEFREAVSDAHGRYSIEELPDDTWSSLRVDGETIEQPTGSASLNTPNDIIIRR